MTKVAVVFANGCEEIEGLSVVDVLRRMGIETTMVGLGSTNIMGAHQIKLTCDAVVDNELLNYDLVAFPGGRAGAENLRDSDELMELMNQRHAAGKWNAAMCAAPIAFARYGLLDQCDYTCFPGINEEIAQVAPSANFIERITVVDEAKKIVTSRGPATASAYAYQIAQVLGYDTKEIKHQMLYDQYVETK